MLKLAGVLIIQAGNYVLQHRDNIPTIAQPDTYSVWGGTFEAEESPIEAALRELREETGVVVKPSDLRQLCEYETLSSAPKTYGQAAIIYLYVLELKGEVTVECYEGQAIVRLPVHSAPYTNLTNYTQKAIEEYETPT
jgi:8-oxo-dGTP pyrophosphatase MutT (NUDIX family)